MMASWEEIGEHWSRAQQMGWEAVQAAIRVGVELTEKKLVTPHGEFLANTARVLDLDVKSASPQASRLMRLALHRELIEQERPQSMRQALALLPKVPRRTGKQQLEKAREEAEEAKAALPPSAKKRVESAVKKQVKVELTELQNQAHDAITKELKAVQRQLQEERDRVGRLMEEADEKRQKYQDLINLRMNGFDYKAGIKVLKQALHPGDRAEATPAVRKKAWEAVLQFERFFS